jgi:hypothetical protein
MYNNEFDTSFDNMDLFADINAATDIPVTVSTLVNGDFDSSTNVSNMALQTSNTTVIGSGDDLFDAFGSGDVIENAIVSKGMEVHFDYHESAGF